MKIPFSRKKWGLLNELLYNPLSLTGLALVALSASLYLVTTLFNIAYGSHGSAYSGLITFIIMPPLLILGLILIPAGILRRKRYLHRRGLEKHRFFIIDFNIPRHRKLFLIFTAVVLFLLILISNMSWQAYHFSESIKFCDSCHAVMDPEAITHKLSPHARVTCAACHVGPGAGWYVRSKLAGLRQVYAVATNSYPRPITTPVHDLRPARDICEQCHWPQYFINDKVVTYDYYQRDDENTHGSVTLQMHVRGNSGYGRPTGIHWHIENIVEFAAVDPGQEDIPWVKAIYQDGKEKIFTASDEPIARKKLATLQVKRMDCITCHNRPSHIFRSPEEIMNKLLAVGLVSSKLTDIRAIGADALAAGYKSGAEADREIEKAVRSGCAGLDQQKITQALTAIRRAYHQNFFPKMKVRWDVHPSNIGHWRSKGCFRCHDGKHRTSGGEVIPRRCDLCHTILSQDSKDGLRFNTRGVPFIHPVDIDGEWKTTNCSQCHTGE